MSELRWHRDDDPDAEYNQQICDAPQGHTLRVFSDRDGIEWGWNVNDEESQFGCDTVQEARANAEARLKEILT